MDTDTDKMTRAAASPSEQSETANTASGPLPPSEDVLRAYAGIFRNKITGTSIVIELNGGQLLFRECSSAEKYRMSLLQGVDEKGHTTSYPSIAVLSPIRQILHGSKIGSSPYMRYVHRNAQEGDCFVGFWMDNGTISELSWQKDRDLPKLEQPKAGEKFSKVEVLRYSRVTSKCHLLALPTELRYKIYEFALTLNVGHLQLYEEDDVLRITSDTKENIIRRKMTRNPNSNLPKTFNLLQYTCKQLMAETQALELHYNHNLESDGMTFHSLQLLEKRQAEKLSRGRLPKYELNKLPWFANVRTITLNGNFTLEQCPDENILHGILRIGAKYDHILIKVLVSKLNLESGLKGFVSMAYLIDEALRGIARPDFVAPKSGNGFVHRWRRNKPVAAVNVPNVRFFPSDVWCEQRLCHLLCLKSGEYTPELIKHFSHDFKRLKVHFKNIYDKGA